MSVADRTHAAFNRRQRCNEEVMRELAAKKEAAEMLKRAVCGCGLPKSKPADAVCPVCWQALSNDVRRQIYSTSYYNRVVGRRAAHKFSLSRKPNPQPMEHRHD